MITLALDPRGGSAGSRPPGRRHLAAAAVVLLACTTAARAAEADADALVARAAALAERAHATGDADAWTRARADVDRALVQSPRHAGARRLLPWIQNGQHRFADARASAEALLATAPDDWWALAQHADACFELGDYAAAETSIDRLAAVRPGPVAWTRIAGLRALLGDRRGAIHVLRLARAATPPSAPATAAWILADLGAQQLALGDLAAAEAAFAEAAALSPDLSAALVGLARTRAAAGDVAAALRVAERAAERAPSVATLMLAGDLHALRGDDDAATHRFALAAVAERVAAASGSSYGRDAVLLFVDRYPNPARALAIARDEARRRHDVGTLDALAWALFAAGRPRAAMRAAHRALRLGTGDATFHYHAGRIAAALARPRAARRHLRAALARAPQLDPHATAIARAILADEAAGTRLAAKDLRP